MAFHFCSMTASGSLWSEEGGSIDAHQFIQWVWSAMGSRAEIWRHALGLRKARSLFNLSTFYVKDTCIYVHTYVLVIYYFYSGARDSFIFSRLCRIIRWSEAAQSRANDSESFFCLSCFHYQTVARLAMLARTICSKVACLSNGSVSVIFNGGVFLLQFSFIQKISKSHTQFERPES